MKYKVDFNVGSPLAKFEETYTLISYSCIICLKHLFITSEMRWIYLNVQIDLLNHNIIKESRKLHSDIHYCRMWLKNQINSDQKLNSILICKMNFLNNFFSVMNVSCFYKKFEILEHVQIHKWWIPKDLIFQIPMRE